MKEKIIYFETFAQKFFLEFLTHRLRSNTEIILVRMIRLKLVKDTNKKKVIVVFK